MSGFRRKSMLKQEFGRKTCYHTDHPWRDSRAAKDFPSTTHQFRVLLYADKSHTRPFLFYGSLEALKKWLKIKEHSHLTEEERRGDRVIRFNWHAAEPGVKAVCPSSPSRLTWQVTSQTFNLMPHLHGDQILDKWPQLKKPTVHFQSWGHRTSQNAWAINATQSPSVHQASRGSAPLPQSGLPAAMVGSMLDLSSSITKDQSS